MEPPKTAQIQKSREQLLVKPEQAQRIVLHLLTQRQHAYKTPDSERSDRMRAHRTFVFMDESESAATTRSLCLHVGFEYMVLGRPEIVDCWGLGGPGGPRTILEGGGLRPPPFGMVFGAPGAVQTPKIDAF